MLVDSHCHLDRLDLNPFQHNLTRVLNAAKEKGVIHFLSVCINLANFPLLLAIAEQCSSVSISVGVHPTENVQEEPSEAALIQLAKHPKVVAIGETGLDYYRNPQKSIQQIRFRRHIRAALAVNKPLIIHMRQASEDTLTILREEGAKHVGGVFHCFTEDKKTACEGIEEGFLISFSGILTFKKATELQLLAQQLPLEKIVVETDSPYLAPDPFRGQSNQPAYVRYVAEKLAALRQLSLEQIAIQTTDNFFRLFKACSR